MLSDPLEFFSKTATRFQSVKRLILFGSQATQTQNETSDFDIGVEWAESPGEWWGSFVEQINERKPFLQQVDLVRLDKIGTELKTRILKEGRVIYEQGKTVLSKS